MKRFIAVFACIVMALCSFTFSASALESVTIEQVLVSLPQITTTIKFETSTSETVKTEDIFAKFGGETLDVNNFEEYDREEHKTTIYVLVDSSSSIDSAYFREIKRKLAEYSDGLTENEKLILIAFGSTTRTLLDGSEDAQTRKAQINALANTEGQTNLFDAVKKAVEMSQSDTENDCERSFAIVISDGDNFETRGGNTIQEVERSVEGHGLPIYAFCVDATNQNASDFGSFARTSGGEIFTSRSYTEVNDNFDNMVNATRDVYLVSMMTKSNMGSDGSEKSLMIRVKEKSANVDVRATRWIKDDEAPEVTDIESVIEDGVMKVYVYYSENVLNADNPDNFSLTKKDSDAEIVFTDAEYYFSADEYYSILTPKTELAAADYKIEIKNVTDSSNEENEISESDDYYELGENSGFVVFLLHYWWIFVVLAVIVVAVLVIVTLLKNRQANKPAQPVEQKIIIQPQPPEYRPQSPEYHEYEHEGKVAKKEKHHIIAPAGKKLRLQVVSGKTLARTIDTEVISGIKIGRESTNDIYVDDAKMSRVHFEIIDINGEFWVNDCGSMNGTLLNNIKINAKRKLKNGDVITAGRTLFTVYF